ncbi:unnamed protein product, partial [Fusarium fujikuroi]
MTADNIIRHISTEFNISTSRKVLYRYLQTWQSDQTTSNITQAQTEDTKALQNRIKELFFKNILKDKNILFQGLIRIRQSLGLLRYQTPKQKEEQLIKLRHFFENDALLNTKLQSFSRTYLYTYIRQKQLSLSQQALYEAFHDFMPTNAWGIKIYTSINTYSRWGSFLPFASAELPTGYYSSADIIPQFKSTHNEKIKSWWHRLSDSQARHWRIYIHIYIYIYILTAYRSILEELQLIGISLLILFRIELLFYIFLCQLYIQNSPNSYIYRIHIIFANSTIGHIFFLVLYHQPEIRKTRSYTRLIPFNRLRPLKELFKHDNINLDAYLPQNTITVYKKILKGQIFPQDTPKNPKLSIYLYLQARLEAYILSGEQPAISLLETPIGRINRIQSHLAAHNIDMQLLNQETQGDIN